MPSAPSIAPAPDPARVAPSASAHGTRPDTPPEAVEAAVQALASVAWATRTPEEVAGMLRRLRARLGDVAEAWVAAAAGVKGLPPGSPLVGEEYLSGPWAVMMTARALERTLRRLARGTHGAFVQRRTQRRPDGTAVVRAFPASLLDAVLAGGVTAEVWLDATEAGTPETARAWREPASGSVTAVMGAGNVAAIAPLDVLHVLVNERRVAVLKLNPALDALGPVLEEAFAEFIAADALRVVYGGAAVGQALTAHPRVSHVHVTGSAATFDAIVYGSGEDGARRKAEDRPLRPDLRVTGELGGVSPLVVVPGPWDAADLRFHAEHVATQRLHNGGFNCIGAQVLVLPDAWPLADRFLDAVREALGRAPARPPYYPGAEDRVAALRARYPEAKTLANGRLLVPVPADAPPGSDAAYAFETEVFAAPLAVTRLPGATPEAFLDAAVAFCNDRLAGSLGASVLVHPATARALGDRLDEAVARLRYGTVGVNAWTGVGFVLPTIPWGAAPGEQRAAVASGLGSVRNALMLEGAAKAVVRAPFAPWPRSLAQGERGAMPYPLWFVFHRRAARALRAITAFLARPRLSLLPAFVRALGQAMRG